MYAGGALFDALEQEIAAGRSFRDDELSAPVRTVIVNQPYADRHFGGRAVGRSLRINATPDFASSFDVTIVGVVRPPSVRRNDSLPMIYYPAPLATMPKRTLLVRYDRPAADAIALLHGAMREVHADVARPEIRTAGQLRWERNSARQFLAAGVSLLGVLALVLAAGGLYGVVSFLVSTRRQEIAVRMALGAEPRRVVGMIIRQALTPAGIGMAAGAAGAAAIGLVVKSRLYGASPVDPVAFGGAAALMLAVLFTASALPARHAARIDPMTVLKQD
jgi:hypothetical protein